METLFTQEKEAPLAQRMRPENIFEVVGQDHVLKEGSLGRAIEAGKPLSFILWGPPGCGKTTLARLYAQAFDALFIQISAVLSGVSDIKKAIEQAQQALGKKNSFVCG